MSIDVGYTIDRENGYLSYSFSYSIPAYIDPETSEYFGDTSWSGSYDLAGNPNPSYLSGNGAESDTVVFELYLLDSQSVANFRLTFTAWNTFMPVYETVVWNVLTAAYVTGPVAIAGTSGIDLVIAGYGDDLLRGFAGNDKFDAGAGDDIIDGGADSDFIDGGAGDDIMIGGTGDDRFIVDSTGDVVIERTGGGNDTVYASVSFTLSADVERLYLTGSNPTNGTGNAGDNLISGTGAANTLSGLDGNDTLHGGAGNDTLLGGVGNDLLNGELGNDTMYGGAGNDSYYVDSSLDRAIEAADAGNDSVLVTGFATYTLGANLERLATLDATAFRGVGNALDNVITGAAGNDQLVGLVGADILDGGDGNDLLIGDAGADTLIGDRGIDTAYYGNSAAAVTVNLATASGLGGDAQGDRLLGIETVVGSAFADTLFGDAFANTLIGGAGQDQVNGGAGNDTIVGGAGPDYLVGGSDIDTVSYSGSTGPVSINLATQSVSGGDAQGDFINGFENAAGGNGNDTITGSSGANALAGGLGADAINGGAGNDTIIGGTGGDTLNGGADSDMLSYSGSAVGVLINLASQTVSGGDAQGDSISNFENATGGSGNDFIAGSGGANILIGGLGNDTLNGGAGNDIVRGGEGGDTLNGGADNDTLSYAGSFGGGVGLVVNLATNTAYSGDAQGDTISNFENAEGSEMGDLLVGDAGVNRLAGRAGFDTLDGGSGNDVLTGGADGDTFVFGTGYGHDTVTDFVGGDFGEIIELNLGAGFDTFVEVMAVATAAGPGGQSTLFTFDAGTSLLVSADLASLTEANFLFV